LPVAVLLAAAAVLLAVSGGVRATVGGLRISARSPLPASVAALAAVGAWWLLARRARAVTSDLEAACAALDRRSRIFVIAIAVLTAAVSAVFATASASGADASGYLSEAAQWASGHLFYREPLATIVGAGDPWLTTPLGWRPSAMPGVQSPTYPPGLPLLMALPHAVGGTAAAVWVVTVAAAFAVIATGFLAVRLAGGIAGVVAAVAIATSPVFLFQSVQPMSDVPVTAAWMLVWVLLMGPGVGPAFARPGTSELRRGLAEAAFGREGGNRESGVGSALAGIACAVAVLIRPNLAPLAAVPLFAIGWNVRRLVAFSIPVAVAGLALMWLQWQWYGSPFRSGYGAADELFALSNIGANASRYFGWLNATSPVLVLAPIGVMYAWRHAQARAMAAFAALVVAAYLVYAVFDVWSYLRFLLPAMAVAAVFTGAAIAAALTAAPAGPRLVGTTVVVIGLAGYGVSQARTLDTFRLAGQQRRVAQAADYLKASLPPDAVVVAGEQSGALRYYTNRSILRWESASPESLSVALATLAAEGRTVVIALDAWEGEPFRAKFAGLATVSLEWPPAFEGGSSPRTRVWRLADRDRFRRGEQVTTQR
jgi:hypothetical protein